MQKGLFACRANEFSEVYRHKIAISCYNDKKGGHGHEESEASDCRIAA